MSPINPLHHPLRLPRILIPRNPPTRIPHLAFPYRHKFQRPELGLQHLEKLRNWPDPTARSPLHLVLRDHAFVGPVVRVVFDSHELVAVSAALDGARALEPVNHTEFSIKENSERRISRHCESHDVRGNLRVVGMRLAPVQGDLAVNIFMCGLPLCEHRVRCAVDQERIIAFTQVRDFTQERDDFGSFVEVGPADSRDRGPAARWQFKYVGGIEVHGGKKAVVFLDCGDCCRTRVADVVD
jgi:hypothetical protein